MLEAPVEAITAICALATLTQSCGVRIASNKAFTGLRAVQQCRVLADILEMFMNIHLKNTGI